MPSSVAPFRPVLALALALLPGVPTAWADMIVETRSGERLVLRDDGTYDRLPPASTDLFAAPLGMGGQEMLRMPLPPVDEAGFDRDRAPPLRMRSDGIADALGVPVVEPPPRSRPARRLDAESVRPAPRAAMPGMPGSALPGTRPSLAESFGYGAAPTGAMPAWNTSDLQEQLAVPAEQPSFESVALADLWDPASPVPLEPDHSLVELRGWMSANAGATQGMLFPDRGVSPDYVIIRGERLGAADRRAVTQGCPGPCEVVVQGRLRQPWNGKPQVEAYGITILP